MTVYELKTLLNGISDEEAKNLNAVVRLNNVSIGAVAHANIISGFAGFDWDTGLFLIQTDTPIVKQREEIKPISKKVRVINHEEQYNCGKCNHRIEKYDNFCPACGSKFKF